MSQDKDLEKLLDILKETPESEQTVYKNSAEQYFAENPFVQGWPATEARKIHWFYKQYCKERGLKPLPIKYFFREIRGSFSRFCQGRHGTMYAVKNDKFIMTKEQYAKYIYDKFSVKEGSRVWIARENFRKAREKRSAEAKLRKKLKRLKEKLQANQRRRQRMIKRKTSV